MKIDTEYRRPLSIKKSQPNLSVRLVLFGGDIRASAEGSLNPHPASLAGQDALRSRCSLHRGNLFTRRHLAQRFSSTHFHKTKGTAMQSLLFWWRWGVGGDDHVRGQLWKRMGAVSRDLPFSRSVWKWLRASLSSAFPTSEESLHGWWWRGAWLTHALAKENLWCPRHWVVSFPFLGSGFSRSFGKHLTHESENTIIPIILLESLDKQGYMCYNTVVLISYQEQLGCYDKVATYRSVPQSSDDRVPRSSSLYTDNATISTWYGCSSLIVLGMK